VGPGPAPGLGDGGGGGLGGEAEDGGAVGEIDVLAQGPLAGADGMGHDGGHTGLTLQAGHGGGLLGPLLDAVDDAGDGREGDAALTEGGQDVLDVTQEEGVGPDHEDALALEGETVGVEEVGGPVQGHGRLAGAGTTLDDEDTG